MIGQCVIHIKEGPSEKTQLLWVDIVGVFAAGLCQTATELSEKEQKDLPCLPPSFSSFKSIPRPSHTYWRNDPAFHLSHRWQSFSFDFPSGLWVAPHCSLTFSGPSKGKHLRSLLSGLAAKICHRATLSPGRLKKLFAHPPRR